ncbi:MAG: glycosyltransferase family 2 protein [Candidatus Eremiobacteraeota bacterium]|nr:glycosyltransferase family 2 protein [Candidatus Eremiobacteraeota bacterium]
MNPQDITAVILTRDEERNLPRALTSLPKDMRVLVLDACSRDHTVQFARGAGAEVVQREWTDFVDARNYALSLVKTPWVLMLDADEALDDVLREAIENAGESVDGYRLKRTTYFCGKPMRLWSGESLLRVFRAGCARLESRPATGADVALHERWECSGPIGDLRGTLLHYSYPDVATYRKKFERYTAIEAGGSRPSLVRLLTAWLRMAIRFPYFLLAKGALLDGPGGIYIAFRSATYPAAVAWKALRR